MKETTLLFEILHPFDWNQIADLAPEHQSLDYESAKSQEVSQERNSPSVAVRGFLLPFVKKKFPFLMQ
jgi:hypothetical protein